MQPAALSTVVLKRADWTNAFLAAIKDKEIDPMTFGPASAFRLRSHPDKAVAKRATELLDELNPLAKAKKEAVAKLLPIVEQKGDAEHGKQLFTTTCTVCHSFHGTGAEIGPNLTGMGAHGANELLVDIVDPNAEVDPSFTQWNIETKDGQAYAGVIASENPTTITLKSLAGVQQIKKEDIKTRVNTQRSLMPEGFDGLGGEALRDIITYLQSADGGRFRMLDLHDAFTTSTSEGLYQSASAKDQTFQFTKTGTVAVDGVPFNIMSPGATSGGANIVVLQGGPRQIPTRRRCPKSGSEGQRLQGQPHSHPRWRVRPGGATTGPAHRQHQRRAQIQRAQHPGLPHGDAPLPEWGGVCRLHPAHRGARVQVRRGDREESPDPLVPPRN